MRKKIAKVVQTEVAGKIKEEGKELGAEFRQKTVTYITAALGLVTGLAWNEAIKSVIEFFFPLNENTMIAKLVYALIMTLILVFLGNYILKAPQQTTNQPENKK
jgi:uncharacterized membrane protein